LNRSGHYLVVWGERSPWGRSPQGLPGRHVMSCSERLCEASTSKAPAHSRIKTCTKPRIAVSCSFACMSGPPGNSSSSSSNGFLEQLQGIASGTSHNLPILKAKPKQRQSKSKTKAKRRQSENTARAMQRQSEGKARERQDGPIRKPKQLETIILHHLGYLGSCRGHLGTILGHLLIMLSDFGVSLEQFWPILGQLSPSWGYLGTLFGPAWGHLGLFGAISSHLGGIFWGSFKPSRGKFEVNLRSARGNLR